MIPGLLHGRLLGGGGGGGGSGIVMPSFAAQYQGIVFDTISADVTVTLTMKSDGTWIVTKAPTGSPFIGAPKSGQWHTSPASGVGSGYQVKLDSANDGPGTWQSLSSDRSIAVGAGAVYPGTPTDDYSDTITVSLRKSDGTGTISTSLVLRATANAAG